MYVRKSYVNSELTNYKGIDLFPLWAPRGKHLEAVIHTFLGVINIGLHRKSFDVVHIHAIGPSLFTPLVRLLGLKVVVTNHGHDYDREKWKYIAKIILRLGEFLGSSFATKLIAVSQQIKKQLKKKYNKDSFYIPNGVTIPQKTPAGHTLRQHGLTEGKYILAAGRLVPEKGFHDLLDAFKDIDTDWKLVIAGDADHEDDYSRSIKKKAKKDHRVVLTGFITGNTLSEIFSNAGFFILPSYHEGLPLTILEAMSYDLPVLASNIPANMELIINEDDAFPPGNIKIMKNKISEFIESPNKGKVISANKKRIKNEFNWDRIAEETMSVYEKVFC